MKRAVFINACIRDTESRTLRIAERIMSELSLKYEVRQIDVFKLRLTPVNQQGYIKRRMQGLSEEDLSWGTLVAQADLIVVAAPFWDMSFPSILKVFLERISADGVTFVNLEDGNTAGNCKAKTMLYITTRGMDIPTEDDRNQGTSYLKALCWLWGIPECITIAAWGLDVTDRTTSELRIQSAVAEGLQWCERC